MRLHSVTVEAFGPFADEVVVDFDALGEDGLFLLHGQTGAGKTTVLDAVAFALFGRVPGVRNEGRRLHSDHAGPDVVPRVVLEATIAGRRMRIDRSPEHVRRKKRGDGVRKHQARGTLIWTDGSGPALTRLPEIGDTVSRLLGMTADQFFQVVLLPQGDFAQFLRADNEDREALLEKLFDTQRFGGVENWLRERARTVRAECEAMAQSADRLAGQISAIAGVETPADPDIAWATGLLDDARTEAARARSDAATAQETADRAQADLDDCTRRGQQIRRADAARAELAILDADADLVDETRQMLVAARRAAGVRSSLDDAAEAAARRDDLTASVAEARDALAVVPEGADLVADITDAPDVTARIDAAVDRWSAESGRLEPLAARAAGRSAMVDELSTLAAEVADAGRRSAVVETELAELPERRADLAARISAATAADAALPGLRAELAAADALVADATRRDALVAPLAAARDAAEAARTAHLGAREALLDIRERRVANMAAELASRLVPGEPCPACGSAEHPAPAHTVDDAEPVTDADERAAEAEEAAAGERARTTSVALTGLRAEYDALVARTGAHTAAQLARASASARQAVADTERLAAELGSLTAQAADLESSVAALTAEQTRLQADRSRRSERAQTVRTALHDLDAEIDAARGDAASVGARRAQLTRLCRDAVALRDATARWRTAHDRAVAATDRAQARAVEAGFADASAARAALAEPGEITRWESQLDRLSTRRAQAQAVLDDPDVAGAIAAGPVDLEQARAVRDATRRTRDEAHSRATLTADTVEKLEVHCLQFWAAVDMMAPARARADEVSGLAEVVAGRGANNRSMSLRSYVLAARLEEVVVAASSRLREMSCGRYEFEHTDAAGSHGRRGGLGIAVRDEYTGAVRPAATLSGGETFFASLALALGLADVVSAEAGGRVLDTMFIDEGFGSLDPETLERVMGVLDDLRSGGRVVGLVSHVDEMRSRIPAQLHVVRTESGSRLEMLGVAV
jgi:exonuclease SbcC